MNQTIIFLFGPSGSGKTTKAWDIAKAMKKKGYTVGGIVSPGTFLKGKRFSFEVLDLRKGEKRFLSQKNFPSSITIGPFGFSQEGFSFGYMAIQKAILEKVDFLILDEIGPLELQNQGWAEILKNACQSSIPTIMITIRPTILKETKKFFFPDKTITEIPVEEAESIINFF